MAQINTNTHITQGGRVVVNAALDKEELMHRKTVDLKAGGKFKKLYDNSSTDDVYMHIVPGEPLFMYKKRVAVGCTKKRKMMRDTDLVVFSSLNGMIAHKDAEPECFHNELTFAGFADIQTLFNSEGYTRVDAVAQVGGLRTTVNTGDKPIRQGDKVYWSLPSRRSAKGHSKIVAELKPLHKHDMFSIENIKEELTAKLFDKSGKEMTSDLRDACEKAERKIMGVATKDFDAKTWAEILSSFSKDYFLREYADIKSRVIGTAMKSAKPGQEFDILINGYSI